MQERHIILIRPGALGDSLLAFPLMRALKDAQPSPIIFVSNAAVLPLAQAWRVADAVYDYGDPRWGDLFADHGIQSPVLRALFADSDLIICWLRDPDGFVQRNLNAIANGRVIVAPGRPMEGQRIHIVDYLAQSIGFSNVVKTEPMSNVVYAASAYKTTIAIHPGSGGARKCWPVSSFVELIQRLWQQAIPVLLLGGPADHERIATLQQLLPAPSADVLTILMDAPLLEVVAALQTCRGYVGNDSGITHLAAMTGLPVVALFGPSDPVVWHPVGPNVMVLYEEMLEHLSVERVWQALRY